MNVEKFNNLMETFDQPNFLGSISTGQTNTTNPNLSNVQTNIINTQAQIDKQNSQIEQKVQQLETKQKQIYGQSQEIEEKIKLLDTRNRMLQLSIDKNIYKKKVIYTLLAIIIGIVVGMLLLFSYFNRVGAMPTTPNY